MDQMALEPHGGWPAVHLWPRVRGHLAAKVGEEVFGAFCGRLEFEELVAGTARLSVPTEFLKRWIERHYAQKLLESWHVETTAIEQVQIEVRTIGKGFVVAEIPPEPEPPPPAAADVAAASVPGVPARRPFQPTMTFERFLTCHANQLAYVAARDVALGNGTVDAGTFNPLFLLADVGLGKTHLLQAIAQGSPRRVMFISAGDYAGRSSYHDLERHALGHDIVLVDDIHMIGARQALSRLVTALTDAGRQIVVASTLVPGELQHFDDGLRSRLAAGLVARLGLPDMNTRLRILRAAVATLREKHPMFGIVGIAAEKIAAAAMSVRDLYALINQLLARHLVHGCFTMVDVDAAIAELVSPRERRLPRIEEIQRVTARYYNMARLDMLSSRRTANVVRPRQIAMYLAKTLTLRSLPEIGRRFGGRDHTTVLHAVRRITDLAAQNPTLAEDLRAIELALGEQTV